METSDTEEPIDAAEGEPLTFADRLPPWAIGTGFVVMVGLLAAMIVIGMLHEMTSGQKDVFNTVLPIVTAVLAGGFGVTIQTKKLKSAEREGVRARKEREQAIRDGERRKADALETAREKAELVQKAKLRQKKAAMLEKVIQGAGRSKVRTFDASNLEPDELLTIARAAREPVYVKDSADDEFVSSQVDELVAAINDVFGDE